MLAKSRLAPASEELGSIERREPTEAQYDEVRAELLAAVGAGITEQHTVVNDRHRGLVDRLAALDRLIQLVDSRHQVTDDWPEDMAPAQTASRRATLTKQLAAERQREVQAERRKSARAAKQTSKSSSSQSSHSSPSSSHSDARSEPRDCCRYCSAGRPCGDSCIASNKTCRKPRGCAY
ncbi:hypothetical protein ENSA7_57340 [Enhygromyxa salina]|uniref:Uncharacterized protein n=1 Tax=Enhygromyxa salina TaxID=215803 RepID=A0A2S9Y7Q5_9BACT|nr:hypothetical protein ENSA7_57340 [Enhygromyxa salina]